MKEKNVFLSIHVYLTSIPSRAGTAYPSGAPETSPSIFSGDRIAQSAVLCGVLFCRSMFALCSFSFDYCIVCSPSISCFWFPLWYLQTFHILNIYCHTFSVKERKTDEPNMPNLVCRIECLHGIDYDPYFCR